MNGQKKNITKNYEWIEEKTEKIIMNGQRKGQNKGLRMNSRKDRTKDYEWIEERIEQRIMNEQKREQNKGL